MQFLKMLVCALGSYDTDLNNAHVILLCLPTATGCISRSPVAETSSIVSTVDHPATSLMGFHKSTFVARGAKTQLDPSCVSAPPATNMDLFASSFVC